MSDLTRELQGKRLIPEAYTLVQAMLGGISWGEVSDVLMDIDVCPGLSGSMDFAFAIQLRRQRISPALLLLYVAFTMLAAPGLPICHTLARTLASTAQAERSFCISRHKQRVQVQPEQERRLFAAGYCRQVSRTFPTNIYCRCRLTLVLSVVCEALMWSFVAPART